MEMFYGVGTNVQYSLTANNYNPVSGWEQKDFETSVPYSCRLAFTLQYQSPGSGNWHSSLATYQSVLHLTVVDNTDVSLQFIHDPATFGTSGNSVYRTINGQLYRVKVDIVGQEDGPLTYTIEFVLRALPNCTNIDATNSNQVAGTITESLPTTV